jgi:hypothetical protein
VSLINVREQGVRLARAIATDLRLYNETRLLSGEDLTAEIAEARELYRERVEPSLYDLFDAAIAEVLPELEQGASSTATAATASVPTEVAEDTSRRAGLPDGLFRDEPEPKKKDSRGIPGTVLVLLVVLAVALWWVVTRN